MAGSVIVFSVILTICSASLIEINETSFARLPALYSLESWTRCTAPARYCLVEAVLLPNHTSAYPLLRNYSAQTLKHFNRTMIHRGMCVSKCLSSDNGTEEDSLQHCANRSLWDDHGLQAEVLSVGWCAPQPSRELTTEERVFAVICMSLVAAAFLATAYHIWMEVYVKTEANKYALAFSVKKNWKILTYNRVNPHTDERMADFASMEGLRVLAIQCVIFSHVLFVFILSYVDNPQYIEKMYDTTAWQITLNAPLWLQMFFSLSACLTAYSFLIYTEKHRGKWTMIVTAIVNRWVRLTPAAVFALLFTGSWFPRLGSGPQWARLAEKEAGDCRQRWWYHVLYMHNHLPLNKFCMGHTWYLAVDMQLHAIGMTLLLIFWRYPASVKPVLGFLLACSALAPALVVYFYELMPIITAQSPESLRTLFFESKLLSLLYVPSYMNGAGYVCGLAVAYMHYNIQKNGCKLNQNKWFNLSFHLSLVVGSVVVATGSLFLHDEPPPRWAAALYAGLDRTLVAVCINVFMLGCFSRCKSLLRSALEWPGFQALGKLSYCVFLMHFLVLRVLVGSSTQLAHISLLACVTLMITGSVITYLVAIPVFLLVESPFLQLFKALTRSHSRGVCGPEVVANPPAQSTRDDLVKSFDLVANVRYNQRMV